MYRIQSTVRYCGGQNALLHVVMMAENPEGKIPLQRPRHLRREDVAKESLNVGPDPDSRRAAVKENCEL